MEQTTRVSIKVEGGGDPDYKSETGYEMKIGINKFLNDKDQKSLEGAIATIKAILDPIIITESKEKEKEVK